VTLQKIGCKGDGLITQGAEMKWGEEVDLVSWIIEVRSRGGE
jgi:hypothetical protein